MKRGFRMTTLVLISHGRNSGANFSDNNIQFIEENSIKNVVIFSIQSDDNSSKLIDELTGFGIDSRIIKLKPLSTIGLEYSDQLRTLSWEISKQIIHAFSDIESPIILLGRGSTLHDHLLWIISSSVQCKQFHWDGTELDTYYHGKKYLNFKIAPLVLSGILELSGRTNLLEFSSEEIAELDEISDQYGDLRKSKIDDRDLSSDSIEDLISEEDMVVTLTHEGFIKRTPLSLYRSQRRGGVGKKGATSKNDEFDQQS